MRVSERCECASATGLSELVLTALEGAPIMCTLAHADMAQRAQDLRVAFEQLVSAERLADGFRWVFGNKPGFAAQLRALAEREHQCCPFVTFRLSAGTDSIVWQVSGPAEAQGVIDVFFRTPQSLGGDVRSVKLEAQRAGLTFSADADAVEDA